MCSRAVRDGDDYVLNGTKRFITGGGVSKLYVYYAVTDPDAGSKGISTFLLAGGSRPASRPGARDKLGIRGSPTTEVICNDVRVPAANRLGENQGFPWPSAPPTTAASPSAPRPSASPKAPSTTPSPTPRNASSSAARSASSQGIQFMLADMAMQIEAARALVYQAAAKADRNDPGLTFTAAAAKCIASTPRCGSPPTAAIAGRIRVRKGIPPRAYDEGQQNYTNI